jgi:hypothetical protein
VIGVAATGHLLEGAGGAGEVAGWRSAMGLCSCVCLAGAAVFIGWARGERLFGADTEVT